MKASGIISNMKSLFWAQIIFMVHIPFKECIFLEKVNTALQNLENHKVLLKDPVRPNEGPWLVMDPVGGGSCVPKVPWYDFLCLECKNMANIADFFLWSIWRQETFFIICVWMI